MNHFLRNDDPLFVKWGRPTIVGKDNGDNEYQCSNCLATWVGPNGDHCYWCHKRWLQKQADFKQSLLVPEWLLWDQAYFVLNKSSQRVWEETRGYTGDFVGAWKRRILTAKDNGEITKAECIAAIKRVVIWMKRLQSST